MRVKLAVLTFVISALAFSSAWAQAPNPPWQFCIDGSCSALAGPDTPVNFSAVSGGATTINLSWSPGGNGAAPDDYDLDFSATGPTGPWTAISIGLVTGYAHTGRTVGVTYYYRVKARIGALSSGYAAAMQTVVSATTFALGYDETYYVRGSETNGWRSASDAVKGWDWSFPGNTTVAPLSGIFMFKQTSAFPEPMVGKRIYKIDADWQELEPTEGNYSGIATKFAALNEILTTGMKNGLPWDGVQIDIRGTVYSIGGITSTGPSTPASVTAPAWLAAHMPDTAACRKTSYPESGTVPFVFFNPAHVEWYSRFRLLIDAIANYTIGTGANAYKIPNHPMLTGQIVHGGGYNSVGEEAGYGWEVSGQPTSKAEFAKTIRRWAGRYNATGVTDPDGITGYQSVDCRPKLEWVGPYASSTADWEETRAIIESGMGTRDGIIERWLNHSMTPRNAYSWVGQSCEAYKNSSGIVQAANYYFLNDPTDPRITQLRWFGDQNEEWREIVPVSEATPKGWLKVPEKWQLNYRMSNLSTLARMLNNTAMEHQDKSLHGDTPTGPARYTNHGVEGFVNPSIIRWLSVNLGKRPYNATETLANETTEAFCCFARMRMRWGYFDPIAPEGFNGGTYANPVNSPNGYQGSSQVLHNFERWLTQREPDGATTPGITTEYGYSPYGSPDPPNADSNSMEIARTGTSIGLRLDDRLRFGSTFNTRPVAVKVTFYDRAGTVADPLEEWTLQYTTASGLKAVASCPKHQNQGGNVVRTVTFFLTDFANSSGVNFKLLSDGKTPFMFVRVIKT